MEPTNNKIEQSTILVTGAAGFIGYHVCELLVKQGHQVVGLDNINDYYSVELKLDRLKQLGINRKDAEEFHKISVSTKHGEQFSFVRLDLTDVEQMQQLFKSYSFDVVCNLAAQVGVRYSLKKPQAYVGSNIDGFLNILECCRHHQVKRLVYASSSSIYGNSEEVPFKESANVDQPISLYAATKKSNELMAHSYSHLYQIETIGLRFFTVYGPWGRPDMAMFLFTDAIMNQKPIKVFNHGKLSRDFTYVDDIVSGVGKAILHDSKNKSLYKLYNIGNGKAVQLMDFINAIEKELGIEAIKEMFPMQAGDVNETWASTELLEKDYDYRPAVNIEKGVAQFVEWYRYYFKK